MSMQQRTLYVGMPGTGKTHTLLNIVSKHLEEGISPKRIAFVSFSKRAVTEGITRAQQTINVHKKELPFFKTLHAIAFNALNLSRDDVLSKEHLAELSKQLGLRFRHSTNPSEDPLVLYNLARAKRMSTTQTRKLTHEVSSIPLDVIKYAVEGYKKYKDNRGLVDFTDMIVEFNEEGRALPVDVAIIDEAQDLSSIQWKMIDIAFANAKHIYFAGDDDQAIYGWAGADVRRFMSLKTTSPPILLNQSYRCPRKICAMANHIANRIWGRYASNTRLLLPTAEEGFGLRNAVFADFKDKLTEPLLILTRNRADIAVFKDELIKANKPFAIDNKPYCREKHYLAIAGYRALQSQQKITGHTANLMLELCNDKKTPRYRSDDELVLGQLAFLPPQLPDDFGQIFTGLHPNRIALYSKATDLKALCKPNINVTTIHASKGAECDNVVVCGRQSRMAARWGKHYPADEHRAFYTAITRSKKTLYIYKAFGKHNYKFP